MRFATTALVAGLAAVSSAFLIPPHFPEGVKDTRFHGGPPEQFKEFIHHLLETKTTTIDLECPGCPFASVKADKISEDGTTKETFAWTQDVENIIHLEFDTHDHSFNVNGHPLLPFDKAQQAQSRVIKAYQIRKDTNSKSVEVPLNFAMEIMPPRPSPHKDGISMIPVEFTVLGIDGQPVKVNTISLKLISPPNGDLVIVHTEEISFKDTPGAETCEGARTWSLCRLRAIMTARVRQIMAATKDKAEKAHGWIKEKTHGCGKGRHGFGMWGHKHPHPPHMHGGEGEHPHPHGWGHHGHHGHHGYHRVRHVLHQTLRFFIIPALLGILGGLAASAIGMLVGQLVVLIWFRAYRRGQRGPTRVTEIVVEECEKDALMGEDAETLPAYEDAPKYEDAIDRDVEAEAVPSEDEKH